MLTKPLAAGRALACAATLTAACIAVPAAHAATFELDGATLVYRAAPGVVNWPALAAGATPGTIRIADSGEHIVPGAGCSLPDPADDTEAECPAPAALRLELGDAADQDLLRESLPPIPVEVRGGPGDDKLSANNDVDNQVVLDGGDGDDVVLGYAFADTLLGGPGNDTLEGGRAGDVVRGGDGDDLLRPDGSRDIGNDIADGGPGYDTIEDWASDDSGRPGWGVTVTIDGLPGDGRPGESDNVTGIEQVNGIVPGRYVFGDSSDRIDVVGYGTSTVEGHGGNDELTGNDGTETIDGGDGDDRVEGGFGHDTLTGGPGRDTIFGDETSSRCSFTSGSCSVVPFGNDTIFARDGEQDVIDCGVGNDRAVVDAVDIVAGCETVEGGASGSGSAAQRCRVTKVKGLTLAKARSRAKRARCVVKVRRASSRTVRKGRVIRSSVRGRTVTLVISRGAAAALSGAAQAATHRTKAKPRPKTYVYDVSYSGRGTLGFAEDGHVEQPADYNVGTTTADIRWRGSVDDVVLRGNDVLRAGTPHSVVRVSLRSQTTRYRLDEAAPSTRACTADAGQAITAGARAIDNPDDLLTPLGGAIRLAVRPFEHATVDMNCTEDGQRSVAAWYVPEAGDAPLGEGHWDADFTLPREALGQGKIIQLVRSTAKQGAAGGCENVGTGSTVTTCRLSWRETVTFRRHKAAKKRPR